MVRQKITKYLRLTYYVNGEHLNKKFRVVNEPWFLIFVSIVYSLNILLKVKTN